MPEWGGIADDFTGATDLAAAWTTRGLRTSVTLGVPAEGELEALSGADAVVVALKCRTAPVDAAVAESRAALAALRRLGCTRFYDKYCSTFDSTPEGNIGPVADALMESLGSDLAVVVPSFPANGRTVREGHLYVNGVPLEQSPMRHHPLTPMTDSSLERLLAPQTAHRVATVPLAEVRAGAERLRSALAAEAARGAPVLAVVDAVDDADLAVIAAATADHTLVTGGSGLALGLPERSRGDAASSMPVEEGYAAVLSGSASAATRGQVAAARREMAHLKLDIAALRVDLGAEIARITDWATERWRRDPGAPVLVYAVDSPADVESEPPPGAPPADAVVEEALGRCAAELAAAGGRRFLIAGGETSGSALQVLGLRQLRLGPALAPGVSWTHGTGAAGHGVNVALKSGNFGGERIFLDCWEALA